MTTPTTPRPESDPALWERGFAAGIEAAAKVADEVASEWPTLGGVAAVAAKRIRSLPTPPYPGGDT